ncbi:MAG: IS110 family transposase [Puniceicoccales bacterium]|nr:IS110 family transposase [Puniceicoccales bacterium]
MNKTKKRPAQHHPPARSSTPAADAVSNQTPAETLVPTVSADTTTTAASAAPTPCANSKGNPNCIGVDIAKATFVADIPSLATRTFQNTLKGIELFIQECKKLAHAHVICEATGAYEGTLVAHLHAVRIPLGILAPARVRHFAKANALHAKTDPIDARLLSRIGRETPCEFHHPTPKHIAHLRDLTDLRRALIDRKNQLQGLLENAAPCSRRAFNKELRWQEKEIKKLEAQIAAHIAATPTLEADARQLQNIRGVGPITTQTLLAHVPEIHSISAKRLSCLVGLAPYPNDSGQRRPSAHIRAGRKPVRDVLLMSARSAIQHNPILKTFYEGLRARGKSYHVCLVAVMRKLLTLMHCVLCKPSFKLA